jgi:preprotein translocase subunit SecD
VPAWRAVAIVIVLATYGCGSDSTPESPATTPTSSASGPAVLEFQPVLSTSTPPCGASATADDRGTGCYTLGSEQWSGAILDDAQAMPAGPEDRTVHVTLDADGLAHFNEVVAECFQRRPSCPTGRVAVVVDGVVYAAVQMVTAGPFEADQIQISGDLSEEDARVLAARLRP